MKTTLHIAVVQEARTTGEDEQIGGGGREGGVSPTCLQVGLELCFSLHLEVRQGQL